MTAPLLAIEHLAKHYGAVEALRGVSFEARAGEVLALLGDNGAGKSTLIKIIAGAQPPSSGRLVLEGRGGGFAGPAGGQGRRDRDGLPGPVVMSQRRRGRELLHGARVGAALRRAELAARAGDGGGD